VIFISPPRGEGERTVTYVEVNTSATVQ
jgi:hypothetical protein